MTTVDGTPSLSTANRTVNDVIRDYLKQIKLSLSVSVVGERDKTNTLEKKGKVISEGVAVAVLDSGVKSTEDGEKIIRKSSTQPIPGLLPTPVPTGVSPVTLEVYLLQGDGHSFQGYREDGLPLFFSPVVGASVSGLEGNQSNTTSNSQQTGRRPLLNIIFSRNVNDICIS